MGKVKSVLAYTVWVGCYRSKLTYPNNMACSTNRISHLSENNCMSIFIVFELLLSTVFIEDEIDI